MINRVNFDIIPFPAVQWSGDIFQLAQLLADHLEGTLDQTVFTGQSGGSEPLTDIGLWLNGDAMYHWDSVVAKYVPLAVVIGIMQAGSLHTARIQAPAISSDIILTLPAQSGQLALVGGTGTGAQAGATAGIGVPQYITQTFDTATVTIDWTQQNIYAVLPGNATIVDNGNGIDTQSIDLWVETPISHPTPLVLTFPAAWRQTAITLTATDATHRAVDHFKITRLGVDTFVVKSDSYTINQAGVGGDTMAPVLIGSELKDGSATIHLYFNKLIRGVSPVSDWVVTKNGQLQTVSSVIITNSRVDIVMGAPAAIKDAVLVKYSGTSVKDLAGNLAATFGFTAINTEKAY